MKLLFVGGVYPVEQAAVLKANCRNGCGLQNAPNVFQWSVINGLIANAVDVTVVTLPFLPSFPMRYICPYTPEGDVRFDGKKIGTMLSYCNLMGYKTVSMRIRLQTFIEKWITQNVTDDEDVIVLTYTPYVPFIKAIRNVKRKFPKILLASIVTDLVDDMTTFHNNRKLLKRLQCKIEELGTKKLYKYIDKYILLSEYMQEKIPEAIGRNIVMEGIYVPLHIALNEKSSSDIKTVLYTGTLEEFAGVVDLVNAFKLLEDPNCCLTICGSGSCAAFIQESAKVDKRIVFRGLVDRVEVLRLQKEATLLVNPRKPTGAITRYSFPSKTMEYLASGTPMMGYKLEGIPSEYYNHYYIVDDMSVQGLATKLSEILSLCESELSQKAASARSFILENKNAKKQMARVLNFLY